jgi:DNA mismatch repair protein MSH5
MVDPPTLAALQIFQEEQHASQMGIGKSKEGFSVYGIMQRCITQMVSKT